MKGYTLQIEIDNSRVYTISSADHDDLEYSLGVIQAKLSHTLIHEPEVTTLLRELSIFCNQVETKGPTMNTGYVLISPKMYYTGKGKKKAKSYMRVHYNRT